MSTSAATTAPDRSRAEGDDRRPAAVWTVELVLRAEAGAGRDPGQAADAVAAHLGVAAVGVLQPHRAVDALVSGARADGDEPVGADAEAPVAEARDRLGCERGFVAVEREPHEEVVAGGVQLGQVE